MKPLNQLMHGSLYALKVALDGYQRYGRKDPDVAEYFKKIITSLVTPDGKIDVWAIRSAINDEDERRLTMMNTRDSEQVNYDTAVAMMTLTRMESKVLRLMSKGVRSEDIISQLGIAKTTFYNHRTHICSKMGIGSVKDLPKFAIDNANFL